MGDLTQSLWDAVGIMLLGIGLVYLFLSVLILGIHLVAKWCATDEKLILQTDTLVKVQYTPVTKAKTLDPNLVAAITLAVRQYRAQVE